MKLSNSLGWSAPSNIAFIKYWGKSGIQIPMNASVSMSLENCRTMTKVDWKYRKGEEDHNDHKDKKVQFKFFFEKKENALFYNKILTFFKKIEEVYPIIHDLNLEIFSTNTFPHSAGIASSASSFCSLALCLTEIEFIIQEKVEQISSVDFWNRASFLARLGSGSACRSVYSSFSLWGKNDQLENSCDEYAIPIHFASESFQKLRNLILIVDDQPKSVSSSFGHKLMNNHIFKDARILSAKTNLANLLDSIKEDHFQNFGEIIEREALLLHALMMTSTPSYILMKPNTLSIIDIVQKFRKNTLVPVYFTLDAGPNLHLIYPEKYHQKVIEFFDDELAQFCISSIMDKLGSGPHQISEL